MSSEPQSRPVLLLHSSAGRYGADRQLRLIADGLDRRRYQPVVVLPAEGPLADDLRTDGVEVLIRPLAVVRRELMSPGGLARLGAQALCDARALGRLIRGRQVALVHSNTSVILSGLLAARLTGVPHICHVREIYTGTNFKRVWPLHRRVLLAGSSAVLCVSAATARQFGPAAERVQVVPDALAGAGLQAPRAAARDQLEIAAAVPVLAVLGRISAWKGQDLAVRALARPELSETGTVLLIAGDAWPGAENRAVRIRELAAQLGVADRVRWLGFRSDVENVFGAADVVVVPSTAPDPLPGAAIEAAAAGCAVLAADHGGLPEIIRDGVTGALFRPGSEAELARVARKLLDRPELRVRLGSAAAADVRRRFTTGQLHQGVERAYRLALGLG